MEPAGPEQPLQQPRRQAASKKLRLAAVGSVVLAVAAVVAAVAIAAACSRPALRAPWPPLEKMCSLASQPKEDDVAPMEVDVQDSSQQQLAEEQPAAGWSDLQPD